METNTHSIHATATVISTGQGEPIANPNDVTFVVAYAEGFAGRKPWPEGEKLTVSKEVAEDFTKRGIGHVEGFTPEMQNSDKEETHINGDEQQTEIVKPVIEDVKSTVPTLEPEPAPEVTQVQEPSKEEAEETPKKLKKK